MNKIFSIMLHVGLDDHCLGEVMLQAAYFNNRSISPTTSKKSPHKCRLRKHKKLNDNIVLVPSIVAQASSSGMNNFDCHDNEGL